MRFLMLLLVPMLIMASQIDCRKLEVLYVDQAQEATSGDKPNCTNLKRALNTITVYSKYCGTQEVDLQMYDVLLEISEEYCVIQHP